MFHRLLFDSIPKSTSILPSDLLWLVAVLDVIAENAQRLPRRAMMMAAMRMKNRLGRGRRARFAYWSIELVESSSLKSEYSCQLWN